MRKIRRNDWYRLLSVCFVMGVLLFTGGCGEKKPYLSIPLSSEEAQSSQNEKYGEVSGQAADVKKEQVAVFVYVCGEVMQPGLYELPGNARMAAAIACAGGMTAEADPNVLNLAQIVSDGQMICVPARNNAQNGEAAAEQDTGDGKINLNTADKNRLMEIPGVGEAKADLILAYRKEKGKFSSIEDIMKIEGIKEGVFRKIQDYICVD